MPSLHADNRRSEEVRMGRTSSQIMRDQMAGNDDEEKYHELDDGSRRKEKPCCGGRLSLLACIALIVASIGLILFFLYLATPAMAQPLTKGATISFDSMQLSGIAMNENQADVKADAVFTNSHGTGAEIASTDVDLMHDGKRVGTLNLPKIDFDGNKDNMVSFEKHMNINANNFNTFISSIFSDEAVDVQFKGRYPMTVGALHTPFGVKGNIPATLTGYNNFDGNMATTTFDIELEDDGTPSLVITVDVTSESEVEIMGLGEDADFKVNFNDGLLADAKADDFSIVRGPNTITLRGPIMASPANGPQTMPPVDMEEEEAPVQEEEVQEEAVQEEAAEEAPAQEEAAEEAVVEEEAGAGVQLLQTNSNPSDDFFSALFSGQPVTLDASGNLVPGADDSIDISLTQTPGVDSAFEGPLIRSLAFMDIFSQDEQLLNDIRSGVGPDITVAINFFNPFAENITITNVNFHLDIGELNPMDPFQPIMRLNGATPNEPNGNAAIPGTLPFGDIDFAGSLVVPSSDVNNGDIVLITTLHVVGDDQLNAGDGDLLANRLERGGRDGNIIGIGVTGDFSFDLGTISGNPQVESTMLAFGCDVDEDQMAMARIGDTKGEIELFCDQVLADDDDLICPPDTPPRFCNIPMEDINDDFFIGHDLGKCREQRITCDINGGCNHVIDAAHCNLPDDVLAGPEDCWTRAGLIVPTQIIPGVTDGFEAWLNVTCCIQTTCM